MLQYIIRNNNFCQSYVHFSQILHSYYINKIATAFQVVLEIALITENFFVMFYCLALLRKVKSLNYYYLKASKLSSEEHAVKMCLIVHLRFIRIVFFSYEFFL